ncbi:hypothetical protein MCEME18_00240 [Candidatus Pelagibacterales bacterium]
MKKNVKLIYFLFIFISFYFINFLLLTKINTISVIQYFNTTELMGEITQKSLLEICNDKIFKFNCHVFRQKKEKIPIFYTKSIHTIDYSNQNFLISKEISIILEKKKSDLLKLQKKFIKNFNKNNEKKNLIKNIFIINFNKELELEKLKIFINKFENANKKNINAYLKKNKHIADKYKKKKSERNIDIYEELKIIASIELILLEFGNMNYKIETYNKKVPSHLYMFVWALFFTLVFFWLVKKKF